MQETNSKSQTTWLKCCVFLAIFFSYLFFAPNYDWSEQSFDTPYGADFLQEWVGARMVLTGNVSQLYDVEKFRAWQHDPSIVGLSGHWTNISLQSIRRRTMFCLALWLVFHIDGRLWFG
jgi:hypothetical protein